MKKKLLVAGIICSIWLAGCSNGIDEKTATDSQAPQSSSNLELLDQPFEEITLQEWETIYLTQQDFDLFLSGLAAENAKGAQKVAGIKKDSDEIIITLDNRDGESLDNLMAAPFIDTKVRTAYLHSAYYEGQQPKIIVKDLSGVVLSETSDALEPVGP
ncbi:hypothetical protein HU147_04865 [Planomicrobium chinense]|uniref:hypothetical protein n=1 Tax=Planococcus chinensis TaxID=272917 RepID=UPI001CC3CB90|nr:hypothetical protein [Planococcus chinensis]MBZ5200546.1 hypothetical protein [Planococcus chinensis]